MGHLSFAKYMFNGVLKQSTIIATFTLFRFFLLQKPYLDGLSDGDPLSVHSEERRILKIRNMNILDFDNFEYQIDGMREE